jgi:malonyl-CoA/methylmalonyl-CoA synthetase
MGYGMTPSRARLTTPSQTADFERQSGITQFTREKQMLFLDHLKHNCEIYSDRPAIVYVQPDRCEILTYGQLEITLQKTITYLRSLGVESGDRVALQLPRCLPFIYLHLAVMRLNAISLPLNPAYPKPELRYFLDDSQAKVVFADTTNQDTLEAIAPGLPALQTRIYLDHDPSAHFAALLADIHVRQVDLPTLPTDPMSTALMMYTSGTTGHPKGAEITHGNLTASIDALHSAWGWTNQDNLLHVLPLFHVHGLVVALHGALHAGATATLLPRFEPKLALDTLVRHGCTLFMAVPTLHKRLVDFPEAVAYDLRSVRLMTSGSDRLPDDLFWRFKEVFGHTLLERYGMTETGMNLSNPLLGERRVGSVGLPLPGVEARVVNPETLLAVPDGEVGELHIRGPHVFKGYWRKPEQTAQAFTADGWFKTGDLALREADGYFMLKGRLKDLIITGGLNVYPPEVELVLADHPAIASSAVVGCADAEWGEQVVAVIILKPGQSSTADNIIGYCRQRLAHYKVPKRVEFVDELPRNTLGKVQKAQLRALLCR